MPRVSIVLPTRNRHDRLALALSSVDAQTVRDFEILVVDDGSSDGTAAWLRAHAPTARVLQNRTPLGAAAARNRGVEQARGDLIAFLDDDDRWRPGYLDAQLAQLERCPSADASYTAHIEVDRSGRASHPDTRPLFAYRNALEHMMAECFVHTLSAVVCRRSAFDRFGAFDERLSIVHDLDWYARLLAAGGSIVRAPGTLVERGVPGGLVTAHRAWFREERAVHDRVLAQVSTGILRRRLIVASRALLFARIGFAKGDAAFGLSRLVDATRSAPLETAHVLALRIANRLRRGRRDVVEAWDAVMDTPS